MLDKSCATCATLKILQISAEKITAPMPNFQPAQTSFSWLGSIVVKKHGLMIDMDGVIYAGEELIKGADIFVKRLLKDKIPFTFLSNNSSKSRAEAVEKLAKLGIKVTEKHIYTSAMATAKFLTEHYPECSVHVLGEGGLLKSLKNAGIRMVDEKPDLVILGEGQEFSLAKVHKAVDMILAGARFIATNRDPSPRREGWNNLGIAAVFFGPIDVL
jgi:NagD protein